MNNFFTQYKNGIIISLIVHLLFLILLFIFGLTVPYPPPAEKGIIIELGRVKEIGKGEKKSKKIISKSNKTKTITPVKTKIAKVDENSKKETIFNKEVNNIKRELKKIKTLTKDPNPKKDYPFVGKINKSALFPGESNQGKGTTSGDGDQGSEKGIEDVKNYDKGENLGAKNINYNLKGRVAVSLYKPIYNNQASGVIVMKITVNDKGKVTNAQYMPKGSTCSDDYLIQAAKKAALSTVFNRGSRAYQIGTISYTFELR